MIRSYKRWNGLAWVNILSFIGAFALIITLIKGFIGNRSLYLLIIVALVALVITIAYVNFISLQLLKRKREVQIRMLFGARDSQLLFQLLAESVVLTGFLVVSGMVLGELVVPFCGDTLDFASYQIAISFTEQVFVVMVLVLLIGVLAAMVPINVFIKKINRYLGQPTNQP